MLAIVGTLLGVLIGFAGQFLIQWRLNTWQREQWIRDNKKAEWSELIGTLCQCVNRCALCMYHDDGVIHVLEGEDFRKFSEANSEAQKTIRDRIFIAQRVREGTVFSLWEDIMGAATVNTFWKLWSELHAVLVKSAQDDLKV
jgi:hypothetical protein